jgi:hypothetical protein
MKYPNLFMRLVANSAKPDDQNENGCWLWTGRTDGKRGGGYGRMNVWRDGKHKTVQPHREMEKIFAGRELCPENETIDHLCANALCINPDHWLLVTRGANSKLSQERNPRGFRDART